VGNVFGGVEMNIFADLHHGDLYYSFYLLFEKRLGFKLYRPIGLEWFHEGFWKIGDPYPDPMDTALQYLNLTPEGEDSVFLNHFKGDPEFEKEKDVYYCWQETQHFHHRGITLEKFKEMNFDIIITSFPGHEGVYSRLRDEFQPSAVLISHLGNNLQKTKVKHVMASIDPRTVILRDDQKVVFCRQEFDMSLFNYLPIDPVKKKIISVGHNLITKDLFLKFEKALPEFEFKMYGINCRDGVLHTLNEIAYEMKSSTFGWMVRGPRFGDGYSGHVFLNWVKTGRPLIVRSSDNVKLPPSSLVFHNENCIDLSVVDFETAVGMIREFSEPIKYKELCLNMKKTAEREIDFDADELKMRKFLEEIDVL